MIDSNVINVVRLNEIFRQARESMNSSECS